MQMTPDPQGVFHPGDEAEVQALVRHAADHGLRVRVAGARHSTAAAIAPTPRAGGVLVMVLDRLRAISFDDAAMEVTVQAGCNVGVDMRDPTGRSTLDNSLCAALDRRGLALPNLGGISHQTIAGMLLTGSCGGSTTHELSQHVVGIRIVDGRGDVHQLGAADGDAFSAAGVSLGLLGVVVAVTLRCEPRFDIQGELSAFPFEQAPFEMTGTGLGSLEAFLRDTPYARLEWWPQQGIDRVVLWQAARIDPAHYDVHIGTPGALERHRFLPFEEVGGTSVPVQAAGSLFMSWVDRWNRLEQRLPAGGRVARALRHGLGTLYEGFVLSTAGDPVPFRDGWFPGLCMDDALDERVLPLSFGEIWLPIEHCGEALRRLRAHYAAGGVEAHNLMACEIYAAGPSPFLLSQGHDRTSVRLNWYWFDGQRAEARAWMSEKYRLFEDLEPRLHWGKVLPADTGWVCRHVRPSLTGWDRFLAQRAAFDPDGRFLSDYWAAHLGLRRLPAAQAPEVSSRRPMLSPGPVPFRCERAPADAELNVLEGFVPFETDRVAALAQDLGLLPTWWPGLERVDLLSGGPTDPDTVALLVWADGTRARMAVQRTTSGWSLVADATNRVGLGSLRMAVSWSAQPFRETALRMSLRGVRRGPAPSLPRSTQTLAEALAGIERALHAGRRAALVPSALEVPPMSDVVSRFQQFLRDLSTRREAALEDFGSLFTEDVRYVDPLRSCDGHAEFREIFHRMFRKYTWVDFVELRSRETADGFLLEYTMRLRMVVGPMFSLPMVTLCRTRGDRICDYVDYFDMASAVLSPSRRLKRAYQRAMVGVFL